MKKLIQVCDSCRSIVSEREYKIGMEYEKHLFSIGFYLEVCRECLDKAAARFVEAQGEFARLNTIDK